MAAGVVSRSLRLVEGASRHTERAADFYHRAPVSRWRSRFERARAWWMRHRDAIATGIALALGVGLGAALFFVVLQ